MALVSNQLVKQVDLPVWEWTRPLPVAAEAGRSCSCNADNPDFNEISGRYVYLLLNATNFWRYDTVTDSYQQLASPGIAPATASSMRFDSAQGYYGRVVSGTSTTITTGLPNRAAVGSRIRIISGRGAGQERIITSVSETIVADWGGSTTVSATYTLTDTSKNWVFNNWIGYTVRIIAGDLSSARKILYNTATVLTVADTNVMAWEGNSMPMSAIVGQSGFANTFTYSQYQIEAHTVTVDTAWTITPDNTSRYVIQSGGIWLASGASLANGGMTLQYYSVLEDVWYAKPINNGSIPILANDLSLEKFTENSSIWYTGKASAGTTTNITDATASWATNQWAGYYAYIWTGTGRGQLASITSNTETVLTFSNTLSTAPNSTSRYNIVGYDAGTLTTSVGRIVSDSTKTWEVNRWANYGLRILAGTGAGQIRQIMSNGTNSIVLYDNWNIQPDNTSIYTIQAYTDDMFAIIGNNAETFLYRASDCNLISHGRILEEGTLQVACAIPTDGTSTATHVILDQKPIAITGLTGTTTITATTAQPHMLKIGQYVSIRGVTSAAADVYNVTGKVQIATVPSATTFTYTPNAPGTGTYQYSENVTLSTSVLPDASKHFADLTTGGSTTTATFTRATPSNINGWYAYGTNIAAGAQVQSGAGTTTLTFNLTGAGTPSGTLVFTKYPRPVSVGPVVGAAGLFTISAAQTIPAYCKGWLASATNTGVGAYLTGGEDTTVANVSIQSSGVVGGTLILSHPTNLPLPATATYSSGTGTSIVLNDNTPTYITGWFVSGTNIANGTTVVSGAGTATIVLSTATSGTPSGTITFYAPTQVPAMIYAQATLPLLASSRLTGTGAHAQLIGQNTTNGSIMTPITALAGASAGVTRYVIAKRDMIGQFYAGQNLNYFSGVAVGTQSSSTLVDTNSYWATATGTGASAGTTITLSAIGSPIHNGWFVSGTGIAAGARVLSGAGTTTITVDIPHTGAVSGTITFTAWSPWVLRDRRLRITSGPQVNQDVVILGVNNITGTLNLSSINTVSSGVSTYSILPAVVPGTGSHLRWNSNSTSAANRGRNLYRFRGTTAIGVDRIDLTDDMLYFTSITPTFELLSTGSSYAYDGLDRIYFTRDVTNRVYYLDLNTFTVQGAGMFPYLPGTAGIGNLMEVIKTSNGLKYLWVNRKAAVENFRQLIFY